MDGLRVDLISLDLKPDLDNANVGKYMSQMNGLCVPLLSVFCVNWGHHFSQNRYKAPDNTESVLSGAFFNRVKQVPCRVARSNKQWVGTCLYHK